MFREGTAAREGPSASGVLPPARPRVNVAHGFKARGMAVPATFATGLWSRHARSLQTPSTPSDSRPTLLACPATHDPTNSSACPALSQAERPRAPHDSAQRHEPSPRAAPAPITTTATTAPRTAP